MRRIISEICGSAALVLCLSATVRAEQAPVKVLFPGNWADPTAVKVGEDYYPTSNNDHHVPSVLVFHSRDLRRWEPLTYASPNEGQGPATDIAFYRGKLYVYGGGGQNPWVMHSRPPFTSWSERINNQPLARPHYRHHAHVHGNRRRLVS